MGSKSRYKKKTRLYELRWAEDHELHGLEITCRAMRMGELEALGSLYDQFRGVSEEPEEGDDEQAHEMGSRRLALLSDMIGRLGKVLVSWNMPDEDTMTWNDESEEFEETEDTKLLPATEEGLRKLEDWEFMAVLESYFNNAVGVSPELGKGSNSGGPSLEELPMTAA